MLVPGATVGSMGGSVESTTLVRNLATNRRMSSASGALSWESSWPDSSSSMAEGRLPSAAASRPLAYALQLEVSQGGELGASLFDAAQDQKQLAELEAGDLKVWGELCSRSEANFCLFRQPHLRMQGAEQVVGVGAFRFACYQIFQQAQCIFVLAKAHGLQDLPQRAGSVCVVAVAIGGHVGGSEWAWQGKSLLWRKGLATDA